MIQIQVSNTLSGARVSQYIGVFVRPCVGNNSQSRNMFDSVVRDQVGSIHCEVGECSWNDPSGLVLPNRFRSNYSSQQSPEDLIARTSGL